MIQRGSMGGGTVKHRRTIIANNNRDSRLRTRWGGGGEEEMMLARALAVCSSRFEFAGMGSVNDHPLGGRSANILTVGPSQRERGWYSQALSRRSSYGC